MEHLTPKETAQFLHANPKALFIDCRSEMEFRFVGHPTGAHHISWNDGPGWEINPHFVDEVIRLAGNTLDQPVVLICRTGDRSVDAGKALEACGFSRVFTVLHGFEGDLGNNQQRGNVNGWRCDGLPWEISACQNCVS
ncbi:Rhodanese-related sulfurtransferase [Georgfuchsia toluolica]|uniref:Rhodanese-related sulfurtransferase n=1 Tax=Georgfuchsia toluolica TaxID=424218 RepID=A0A916J481_9PROT|nr:rhodanese-like domain-containing protein [Georgfuchsia toluolica]CAG4883666.1 Rhodanese-related sulfurtransferase [Georgfuchsia toluolica]